MYIWAPVGNPTSINEANARKLTLEPQYWIDYYNEPSEAKRANFLNTWEAPGNVDYVPPVVEPEVAAPTRRELAEPAKVEVQGYTGWLSD